MTLLFQRSQRVLVTMFVGLFFWLGLAVVNQSPALADPPGAESSPRSSSLEFRHNNTRDIMRGAAQDNGTPAGAMSSQDIRDRSAIDNLRVKSRDAAIRANRNSEDLVDTTQSKLKNAADNVREKLNLDEPIAPETKEFFGNVKDRVDDAVAPITGDRTGGYYSNRR